MLPISYAAAEPLLAALGGRVAPAAWRGGLPLTYHLGPGPAKVHLKVLSDWSQKTLYDVIATIRGARSPIDGSFAAIITMAGCSARPIRWPARWR